jgi:thiamine kinase-like enzyme
MVCVTSTALPLLPLLQRVFPDIASYQIEDTIVQSNADGFGIIATSSNTNDDANDNDGNNNVSNNINKRLFVKCVEASKYSNRPWADLRRALLYSRTEARFYSDILPLLRERSSSNWDIAPKCYLAESCLDDLIGEDESTAAEQKQVTIDNGNNDPKYNVNDDSILQGKGGNLILESLKDKYYQSSPLTLNQASDCLSAVAKFHAAAFEDKEILQQVSTKLCEYGGSYHLSNRNPKELNEIRETWDQLVADIRDAAPSGFFEREHIMNIGQRIYDVAGYVSKQLSPSYGDDCATLVHGDYKAMNVFLPLTATDCNNNNNDGDENGEPLLIDFSSVGIGLGVSDIAMHIPHAVSPQDLENGGEEQLVEHYYQVFHNALPLSKKDAYTKEQFMRHYRFATVDYFRFILGRMWKGLTLEVFEKRRELKNFAEFNRTIEAALAFIERVDKYLIEIEKEIQDQT